MGSDSKAKRDRLKVIGKVTGTATPFPKYLDQFPDKYEYSQSAGYDAKRFVEIKFAMKFKYFETVSSDDFKGYI